MKQFPFVEFLSLTFPLGLIFFVNFQIYPSVRQMILECHRAVTGMPPLVMAMEEGRYGLWRLRADDDDDDGADKLVTELFLTAHQILSIYSCSAVTLLVGQQEGHLVCKESCFSNRQNILEAFGELRLT